jgi:hypothetical protein
MYDGISGYLAKKNKNKTGLNIRKRRKLINILKIQYYRSYRFKIYFLKQRLSQTKKNNKR